MSSFKTASASPEAPAEVTNYVPRNLDAEANFKPLQNFNFVEKQSSLNKDSFEIDPQISSYIGLTEAKAKEQQKKFDGEVFRYVQKIKDNAYQEAYQKGLEQGAIDAKAQAYEEARAETESKIKAVVELVNSLSEERQKMLELNEKEIIHFCYFMANKIVYKELKEDKELIVDAIKKIANQKDDITVKLSATDHQYVHDHLDKISQQLNISKIRFEKDETLAMGDVVVEGSQGVVDGTLETRLQKMKSLLDRQE